MRFLSTSLLALPVVAIVDAPTFAQTTELISRSVDGAPANGDSGAWFSDPSTQDALAILGSSISSDGRYVLFSSRASNLVVGDSNGAMDVFVYDAQTGAVTRLSVDSAGAQGEGDSFSVSMSADDRYVAIVSSASNLVPNDTNGTFDVIRKDRQTGSLALVSVASNGVQANGPSTIAVMTADARYVVFESFATNLAPGVASPSPHVYVHDMQSGTTTIADVSSTGTVANGPNVDVWPSISADGRYVVFVSSANNLIPGDTNGLPDAFVHDMQTGITTRVGVSCLVATISADGRYVAYDNTTEGQSYVHDMQTGTDTLVSGAPLSDGFFPSISADGRYVMLSTGTLTGTSQIFVRDMIGGNSRIISYEPSSTHDCDGFSFAMFGPPVISADDRYFVFMSTADDLDVGDTNGKFDVFRYDMQTGQNTRVSASNFGLPSNANSADPSMSADARYVAFASTGSDLAGNDTNGVSDVFVRDRQTGTTARVSVSSSGTQGNGASDFPALTPDGRYVAFASIANTLVTGDTNATWDVFVRDLELGTTTRVSVDSSGAQGNGWSTSPAISADGRYVAFQSDAPNLVAGDTNGQTDVFVRDLQTGVTTRMSVGSSGVQGNFSSVTPAISADGRYVVFSSSSSNLVANDTNGAQDVFVHDRQTGTTKLVSVNLSGIAGAGASTSYANAVSADGRFIAFSSSANDLVPGDTSSFSDVFVRDMTAGVTTRMNYQPNGSQSFGVSNDNAAISPDGRFVVFDSLAADLVPGDTNSANDTFLHDRVTGTTERVSLSWSGAQGNSGSLSSSRAMSADGRYVVFASNASNLLPVDANSASDVLLRDRGTSSSFASFCFGDGSSGACPCGNTGSAGHGCQNSGSTGGALLAATGVASLSADSVHMTSSGEMPTSTSIVLQGDAAIAATPFGNGLRCTGGHLKRPYTANASGGVLAVPPTGQPSFAARSAALGDTISAGSTRIYQVYYHDPSLTFCPNGFNVSNAIAVAWGS
jgi:Tol biopolymer transport system component